MKTLLSFIVATFLFADIAFAQEQLATATINPKKLKDGYGLHNGKMIQIKQGTISPLTQNVTLKNGTKITPDGRVIMPGKKPRKLQEDYAVNLDGHIVMLNYDMMTYEAIQEHSQKTLGNTNAEIIITDKGAVIGRNADGTGTANLADADALLNRRVEIINERNELVKQKAVLLNKLKDKAAQQSNPEVAKIDVQIKELSQELQQVEEKLKTQ